MSPEFDPTKNAANVRKHGVSLADGHDIRIISVRKSEPSERRTYEEGS